MAPGSEFAHFLAAQEGVYERVLRELSAGKKQTHWMWFIFPQLAGLGVSPMSQKFAIHSLAEAGRYLQHEVLGPRLRECTTAMLEHAGRDVSEILGYPDELKLRSSMTLFAVAAPEDPSFAQALKTFFVGQGDPLTIQLLGGGTGRDD